MHNLDDRPRRPVLLHLDGVSEVLAEPGTPVLAGAREVAGWASSSATTSWAIALALVKQSVSQPTPP